MSLMLNERLEAAERQHKGLATEAGRACLRFNFEQLDLERVEAFALPENVASIHVPHKLGLKAMPDLMYDGVRALRYGIDRVDFGT